MKLKNSTQLSKFVRRFWNTSHFLLRMSLLSQNVTYILTSAKYANMKGNVLIPTKVLTSIKFFTEKIFTTFLLWCLWIMIVGLKQEAITKTFTCLWSDTDTEGTHRTLKTLFSSFSESALNQRQKCFLIHCTFYLCTDVKQMSKWNFS